MAERAKEVHEAFLSCVASAAAAGIAPPSGLTPREQCRRLADTPFAGQADVPLLAALVERCLYERTGSDADFRQAVQLCLRVNASLQSLQNPNPAGSKPSWAAILRCFQSNGWIYGLIVIVLALGVFLLSNLEADWLGPVTPPSATATWHQNHGGELRAIEASRSSNWRTAPSKPTVQAVSIPRFQMSLTLQPPVAREIDTLTGQEHTFPNAKDPFKPPLHFTHRQFVLDRVTTNFEWTSGPLRTYDGKGLPESGSQRFQGHVQIRCRSFDPVPIPSPTPDAVVTDYSSTADGRFTFLKDDNGVLYAVSARSGEFTLDYELGTEQGYHNYAFAPLPDIEFTPREIPMPDTVRESAQVVISAIGGLPAPTYSETVRRLHAYFAGFSVCPIEGGEQRDNEFLTVALARKGVCRHRSRTFAVVAQALGIPTRVVENQIHSFAEVQLPDGNWRRLEFRLAEGEGAPGPDDAAWGGETPAALRRQVLIITSSAAGLIFIVLLLASHHHRTIRQLRLEAEKQATRTLRRSRRPSEKLWNLGHQLALSLREHFARRLGPDATPQAIYRATLHGLPEDVQPIFLRFFDENAAESARIEPEYIDFQTLFWTCRRIFRPLGKDPHSHGS